MAYTPCMGREGKVELRHLAATQHGHFTNAQAAMLGVSSRSLTCMRRSGEIEEAHLGIARFNGSPLTWHGRVMAAVLAAGPGAVAGYDTALRLLGLSRHAMTDAIEIVTPRPWLPDRPGIVAHRTRQLERCDRGVCESIPLTSGARTVIDVAGRRDRTDTTALVDDAVCARVTTRRWLFLRGRALRNGRRGVGLIVSLTHPDAAAEFWSWLEREADRQFARHGVPAPLWNTRLYDDKGYVGVVDALWKAASTVAEIEGLRFHTNPTQRRNDARRYNRISRRHRLLRYTWLDIVERPAEVAIELREALSVGGGDPLPDR